MSKTPIEPKVPKNYRVYSSEMLNSFNKKCLKKEKENRLNKDELKLNEGVTNSYGIVYF